MYPDDQLSDQSERFFVSEIIREKIFLQFREEVPYATEVYIVEFREGDDKDFISAEIEQLGRRGYQLAQRALALANRFEGARTLLPEG